MENIYICYMYYVNNRVMKYDGKASQQRQRTLCGEIH
jgi:hypothetical protein